MARWHSLFIISSSQETLAGRIRVQIEAQGYGQYNPFGLMPGIAYEQTLKTFTAPEQSGWLRVLVEASHIPDVERLATAITPDTLCLSISLQGAHGGIIVSEAGQHIEDPLEVLLPHLQTGKTPDDLQQALGGAVTLPEIKSDVLGGIPLDDLPDDLKGMTQQLDLQQADKMFGKISRNLLGRQAQAGDMLNNPDEPDWNSPAGQHIRAVLACLTLPDTWRLPDFTTLRVAYQLHARKQRKTNAPDLPGDAEAMAVVPDALDYVPVYGGKDGER